MGILSIILASLFVSRPRGDLEDPEKSRQEVEPAENDDDGYKRYSRDLEQNDDFADDNDSVQDSDPHDADEDEAGEELSSARRRVTFGRTSGESSPLPETAPAKPRLPDRLRAFLFPPHDNDKPLSSHRTLPVISGLVIPFCILLEIPGLTDSWYIRTDKNRVVQSLPNPASLDVMLGISMFFAVAANVSLISRFLEKGTVLTTTLATVGSLTIHDAVNIIAVVSFGVQHRFDDGFTYGHGYWMTVCSTSVSTATNISLIWDLVWTRNFAKSGSGVSRKQRSLLVIVMLLFLYIAFGALVNSFLLRLDFINALYFTVVSIETVGFGDIVPDSTGSRVFMCFYIIFGILNLGVAVGVARETIFEQLQVSYQRRLARIRKNYQEHRNWRSWERKWRKAVEWRLKEIPADTWVFDLADDSESTSDSAREESKWARLLSIFRTFRESFKHEEHHKLFRDEGEIRGTNYGHPGTHLNVEALSRAQLEAAAVESGVPLCVLRALRRRRAYMSRTHTITSQSSASSRQYWRRWFTSQQEPLPTERPTTEFMRGLEDMAGVLTKFAIATTGVGMNKMPVWTDANREIIHPRRYPTMDSIVSDTTTLSSVSRTTYHDSIQEIADKEERKAFWAKLVVVWTLFMIFWLVGAALFVATEKWTYGIATYFCFITFTTTGYGDYAPSTPAGRSVFVFWALLGLATMTILVSFLQDAFSSKYKNALHSGVFESAVKRYRQKTKSQSEKKEREKEGKEINFHVTVQPSDVKESSSRAQRNLENLPAKVLGQTELFHRHIQFLVQSETGGIFTTNLESMLDDVDRAHKMDEKLRDEILQDEDARNKLCILSFEKALRELVDVVEDTQTTLAERDLTAARYNEQQQANEYGDLESPASGSGTCHHDTPHDSDAL